MQNEKNGESYWMQDAKETTVEVFFAMCFVIEKFYVRCYLHLVHKYIFLLFLLNI